MSSGSNLVLLSAGLDSAVNLLLAMDGGGVGMAVTVDYGQKAARREVEKAGALCSAYGVEHTVLDATWLAGVARGALMAGLEAPPEVASGQLEDANRMLETMRAVWVPNRNGLLANMGACVAEALGLPWVVMGLNAEEAATFRDNSAGFVRETNRALSYATLTKVRLKSFTIAWDKMGIMREAMARELDFRYIWSCYNDGELMCGTCESCARMIASAERLQAVGRLRGLFAKGP